MIWRFWYKNSSRVFIHIEVTWLYWWGLSWNSLPVLSITKSTMSHYECRMETELIHQKHLETGLEKVLISPWLVTLLHICGVIPIRNRRYRRKLHADIAGNSAGSPTSPRRAPTSAHRATTSPHRATTSPHPAPISSHRMTSARSPTSLPQTQMSPYRAQTSPHRAPISSHRMTTVSWCFTMF